MSALHHLAGGLAPDHDSPGPTMVLLHGFGSNERDLPGLTPYLPPLPWVSLRAPLPMPGGGAAWFPLALPDEPEQSRIDEATAMLWDALDVIVAPGTPLVPVGFSQGGLMALQMLRTRPAAIRATVMLAGFVTDAIQPADDALAQDRPSVFWGRGDADPIIWPAAIERTERLLPQISHLTRRVYPGLGHSVDDRVIADVDAFIREHATTGASGTVGQEPQQGA